MYLSTQFMPLLSCFIPLVLQFCPGYVSMNNMLANTCDVCVKEILFFDQQMKNNEKNANPGSIILILWRLDQNDLKNKTKSTE